MVRGPRKVADVAGRLDMHIIAGLGISVAGAFCKGRWFAPPDDPPPSPGHGGPPSSGGTLAWE